MCNEAVATEMEKNSESVGKITLRNIFVAASQCTAQGLAEQNDEFSYISEDLTSWYNLMVIATKRCFLRLLTASSLTSCTMSFSELRRLLTKVNYIFEYIICTDMHNKKMCNKLDLNTR